MKKTTKKPAKKTAKRTAKRSARKPSKLQACLECGAECCRYFAVWVEEPADLDDWDVMRWYLHHRGVMVYVDYDEDWYVHVSNRCRQLDPRNRCRTYASRPNVCSGYEHDVCEASGVDPENVAEFHTVAEMDAFIERNFRVVRKKLRRRHRKLRAS